MPSDGLHREQVRPELTAEGLSRTAFWLIKIKNSAALCIFSYFSNFYGFTIYQSFGNLFASTYEFVQFSNLIAKLSNEAVSETFFEEVIVW